MASIVCPSTLGEKARSDVGPVTICACGAVVDLPGVATRGICAIPEHPRKVRG